MPRAYYNEFDPYAAQWLRNLIAAGHIAPGEVIGVFGKTVDVKFQDRTRAVPVANLEIDAPIDNGYWSRQ